MIKVYIASPYSQGDTNANVKAQIDAASILIDLGYAPYVPVLTHYIHLLHPKDYETWMEQDFLWVRSCNALLRLPGNSPGADREVKLAKESGIPVFFSIEDLCKYYEL